MPNRAISKLNLPTGSTFNTGPVSAETVSSAPVPLPAISAPTNLSLTTANERSDVTPSALISATWLHPPGIAPSAYTVQVASDSAFATIVDGMNVPTETAVFHGLNVATLYYVRVAAIAGGVVSGWSATASITTASDTTLPAPPTSATASFLGSGDLVVTWTPSSSANARDTEIRIWDSSSKTTLYATIYNATGRYVWTAAQNLAATSGTGAASVYVELRTRGYNNLFSAAVVVGSTTKTRPATPGGIVQSWNSDTGTAGADWTIAWAAQNDATLWQLTINGGTPRTIANTTYTYTLDANIAQNTSADPTLSYSLVAMDALGQSSAAAASGAATNAAPPTTAITAVGAVNAIAVALTASAAADFAAYSLRIVKDGATQATVTTRATTALLDVGPYGSGAYQIGVTVVDAFGQSSTEMLSASGFLEPFTLTTFRGGARYRDSVGNSSTSLDVLKDDNLVSGGVSYT